MENVVNLKDVNLSHVNMVGGKNASTGEMIQHLSTQGILVPGGYATTAHAYKQFIAQRGLDKKIAQTLASLKVKDVKALNKASAQIRRWIVATPFLSTFENEIKQLLSQYKQTAYAIRSSATAEDLPDASFAGQQETYLNVKGVKPILQAIKLVFASLFTSRAISYRHDQGFDHLKILISVGIQPMIRSDKGSSGVMFTLDTESGFDKVILINASYGLGEAVVQGHVTPDEFYVYKPSLENGQSAILQRKLGQKTQKMVFGAGKHAHDYIHTVPVAPKDQQRFCISDHDIEILAKNALLIEKHYKKPMDIEWAKDGITGELYIVQARPETVKSLVQDQGIERYTLTKKGKVITEGLSVGQRIGTGIARIILDPKDLYSIKPGEVLVTDMTDPDWEPIMKRASAIVTNRGGRTCHAAIIARELGIPAVVGCVNATKKIKNNEVITVACAQSEIGYVYAGKLPFEVTKVSVKDMPPLPMRVCINLGNPEIAFATQFLPNDGVGLARLEFLISKIGVHPNAALGFKKLPRKLQQEITKKIAGYPDPVEYYVEKLREGISKIAAAFYPKEVIFRFSDFKSNEYANLLGGSIFEPHEENPMLGFRGAARYRDKQFFPCFKLECEAIKRVRNDMGLVNAQVMIPFVRTVDELRHVTEIIETCGLKRGEFGLKIYMMCEIPSNVLLAREFLPYVDGYSIGTNDLTQLVLGLDRDSSLVAHLFDERNEAIKLLLHAVIQECNRQQKYIGICGQGPSDHPDFAEWLMQEGIQSISLNPDTVIETWLSLARINDKNGSPSSNNNFHKMRSV